MGLGKSNIILRYVLVYNTIALLRIQDHDVGSHVQAPTVVCQFFGSYRAPMPLPYGRGGLKWQGALIRQPPSVKGPSGASMLVRRV